MDIGMRSLHPAAADHSVSIRGSRCTALIMLSLRSRVGDPAAQQWYRNCGDGTWRLRSLLQGTRVTYVTETFPFSRSLRVDQGRSLQTNLGDRCTQKCVSASTSWTAACEVHGSKLADPRSVVTHHLSWAQWSRDWTTPTPYRLEGPALSRPSPVGLRFPHAK